ncbi:hypothetical protein H257_09772 [Aphanomyces astaci]|uniref:Uncharacterized protein n=1 Tax=Aphanomyces astaci TaxID=112090 RepID=W4G9C7_APHAT|nr:hypothetical protein H257_09772 [Aphanomyces astaci]ETV76307.1 hypothetical protein H257_09772 [Aphanomyces astaci]|eukprot:XP_009834432.1 hypothetical protein H257_09772 [Aphanomyces astaci]
MVSTMPMTHGSNSTVDVSAAHTSSVDATEYDRSLWALDSSQLMSIVSSNDPGRRCRWQNPPTRECAKHPLTLQWRPPPCLTQRCRACAGCAHPCSMHCFFWAPCLKHTSLSRARREQPLTMHCFLAPWRQHNCRAYTWLVQFVTEHVPRRRWSCFVAVVCIIPIFLK